MNNLKKSFYLASFANKLLVKYILHFLPTAVLNWLWCIQKSKFSATFCLLLPPVLYQNKFDFFQIKELTFPVLSIPFKKTCNNYENSKIDSRRSSLTVETLSKSSPKDFGDECLMRLLALLTDLKMQLPTVVSPIVRSAKSSIHQPRANI